MIIALFNVYLVILFILDPIPYQAQVDTIAAQLKFEELRLSQMNSARPTLTSSRGNSWAQNITWTRPSFALPPKATLPISGC
jgi:hypothetical protein